MTVNITGNFTQTRSVCVGGERNHLAGRGYKSMVTEGTLEEIIKMRKQSVVLQNDVEDL